ncbi:Esterase [Diplonema papillatum]|nr:Esterase [Diplonema papillatum]|eukprot:gene12852-19809_t
MSRKLRILLVHGHAQTGEEMAKKCGSLRSEVKKMAEFVTYESPVRNSAGEQTHYDFERLTDTESKYTGIAAAVGHLVAEFEKNGPFDGIWGFSMGAVMAALLADGLQQGSLPPAVDFKFAILFSAPYPKDPVHKIAGGIATPSFHCYGMSDQIIPPESSKLVEAAFMKPSVITHEGGHLMPSAPAVRKALKAFVREQKERLVPE